MRERELPFFSIGLAAGLCRNRRGRETAATASRTRGVGRQPLLNAVHVEAMVTPS